MCFFWVAPSISPEPGGTLMVLPATFGAKPFAGINAFPGEIGSIHGIAYILWALLHFAFAVASLASSLEPRASGAVPGLHGAHGVAGPRRARGRGAGVRRAALRSPRGLPQQSEVSWCLVLGFSFGEKTFGKNRAFSEKGKRSQTCGCVVFWGCWYTSLVGFTGKPEGTPLRHCWGTPRKKRPSCLQRIERISFHLRLLLFGFPFLFAPNGEHLFIFRSFEQGIPSTASPLGAPIIVLVYTSCVHVQHSTEMKHNTEE